VNPIFGGSLAFSRIKSKWIQFFPTQASNVHCRWFIISNLYSAVSVHRAELHCGWLALLNRPVTSNNIVLEVRSIALSSVLYPITVLKTSTISLTILLRNGTEHLGQSRWKRKFTTQTETKKKTVTFPTWKSFPFVAVDTCAVAGVRVADRVVPGIAIRCRNKHILHIAYRPHIVFLTGCSEIHALG